jgi:predicted transcriptional regulator
MELKTKPKVNKKEKNPEGGYYYTYTIKNGEKVVFKGDDSLMEEFDIHQYGDGGTLYYRK